MLVGAYQMSTRSPLHIILHQSSDGSERAALSYTVEGSQPVPDPQWGAGSCEGCPARPHRQRLCNQQHSH